MTRFTEVETITRQKEAIAPKTEILWDVVTNSAKIYFTVNHVVYEDGVIVGSEQDKTLDMSRLVVDFASIANRTFNVPLPGGGVQPVPAMLIMGAIKQAFDELYSEYRNPVPSPTPTPTVSHTPSPYQQQTPPVSADVTPPASADVTPPASPTVPEPTPSASGV